MATLKDLQDKATGLGIEFKAKATKSELEALIAEKEAEGNAPDNVESNEDNEGAKKEATQSLEENEQNDEQNEADKLAEAEALKAEQDAEAKKKADDEAEAKAKAEKEAEAKEPKKNKDGHIAGEALSPDEVAKYLNRRRSGKK